MSAESDCYMFPIVADRSPRNAQPACRVLKGAVGDAMASASINSVLRGLLWGTDYSEAHVCELRAPKCPCTVTRWATGKRVNTGIA